MIVSGLAFQTNGLGLSLLYWRTKRLMAILVADQPLDYPKINAAMKANAAQGLDAKLAAVVGNELIDAGTPTYSEGGTFGAKAPAEKTTLAIVLKIEKQ